MRVSKWVDFGQEVDIEIDFRDVQSAMGEAFERATEDRLGEEPSRADISRAINMVGTFLKALPDAHIAVLGSEGRKIVHDFLLEHAARFTEATNGTEPSRAGTHATVVLRNEGADTKGEKGKQ